MLFQRPTLSRSEYGPKTKRKQALRLEKKGIVHMPDSKASWLFRNLGRSVFVRHKDIGTRQTMRGGRNRNSENDSPTHEGKQ